MAVIVRYSVSYFSSHKQGFNAEIQCFAAVPLSSPKQVASIRFFKSLPIPKDSNTGGNVILNFPLDRFNDVIGILRNETDVYVDKLEYFSLGGADVEGFAVYTSREVTGDLEVQ